MSALSVRLAPGMMPRNGMPVGKFYRYQGTGEDTLTAFLDDEPEPVQPTTRTTAKPCGTGAAYRRHLRHGERPCEPCMQAVRREWLDRAARRAVATP